MKPKPWDFKWERSGMRGIARLEQSQIKKDRMWLEKFSKPWEKYDLMNEYRYAYIYVCIIFKYC